MAQKSSVGEMGMISTLRVGKMGVGEMGVGKTGVGKMGVGQMGIPRTFIKKKTRSGHVAWVIH